MCVPPNVALGLMRPFQEKKRFVHLCSSRIILVFGSRLIPFICPSLSTRVVSVRYEEALQQSTTSILLNVASHEQKSLKC